MKALTVTMLSCMGHTMSVGTAQLCHSVKVARDNMQTNEHGCVPTELFMNAAI